MTVITMDGSYDLTVSGSYAVIGASATLLVGRLADTGTIVDSYTGIVDSEFLENLPERLAKLEDDLEGAIVYSDALLSKHTTACADSTCMEMTMRLSRLLLVLTPLLAPNAGLTIVLRGDDQGKIPSEAITGPIASFVRAYASGRGRKLRINVLARTDSSDAWDEGTVADAAVYMMMESMMTGMTVHLRHGYLHQVF